MKARDLAGAVTAILNIQVQKDITNNYVYIYIYT